MEKDGWVNYHKMNCSNNESLLECKAGVMIS